jgi:hypothetical protein
MRQEEKVMNRSVVRVITAVVACVLVSAPAFASLKDCSKLIDGESGKMQSGTLKAFQKCNDAYRKDVIKPPTPPLAVAAAACEKALAKVLAAGSGSLSKSIAKLAGKTPKTCNDGDLMALGHLPTITFGSAWADFQGIAALQSAYEQQLMTTRDWANILLDLGGTNLCPSCVKLNRAPCLENACKLSGASANVDLNGLPQIDVTLSGFTVLKICDRSQLLGSATSGLFVMSTPARILAPVPLGSFATACVKTIAAEGLIQCGVGAQAINYTACQDHDTGGQPNAVGAQTSGACSGDACLASATDVKDATITNGGVCTDLTAVPGVAGDAFVYLTSQIGLAPPANDCTNETTFTSAGTPQITPLTTGTAVAAVKNADALGPAVQISSATGAGVAFNCTTIPAGASPGVRLVGAFPAINTLEVAPGQVVDSVTGFTLQCE